MEQQGSVADGPGQGWGGHTWELMLEGGPGRGDSIESSIPHVFVQHQLCARHRPGSWGHRLFVLTDR